MTWLEWTRAPFLMLLVGVVGWLTWLAREYDR